MCQIFPLGGIRAQKNVLLSRQKSAEYTTGDAELESLGQQRRFDSS